LKERTGAPVLAEGPHRPARRLRIGEINPLDASADLGFVPDIALADGSLTHGDGWAIRTVLTPGHTANHAAFALEGTGILFSADHVMAWATSIVAPPDGAMADYMKSLDRLIERDDRLLLPGHGGPVTAPRSFMRGLKSHRKMREQAILERILSGDRTIKEMVAAIYRDTDPRLHGAAGLSVLAHLEDLVARGLVASEGDPAIDGIFRPAG
ncbi:MBL fold metallo-hydrolase, partial [Mesorhizobium sp.]